MHEITLCQRALELIEQQASAYGAKRVTAVWIKIGAFFLRGNQRSFLLF
ncbi:hydrogenase nickel incorporation protein [Salmonella enterica subsp. enterica serovar Daytona]|uniref:Hydrogenase nickel incorporation protein n=1 Tax=Salmonella enterica subsp. enterica serovar Daytona TaxID=1962639 RepID=A0A447JDQ2_SALET|nr:hydrogenase nickel incorporation protein [Salmonella enterica subsp. enterica serovar Daytona]